MTDHPALTPGHVAVVTGAASGIGLAAARAFGQAGMTVVLADIDADPLEQAASSLRADGIEALGIATDVRDRDALAALKARADTFGPVAIVMNNAARAGAGGLLADGLAWHATLDVNFWGVFNGVQAFLPGMLAADWPCAIVNTGSKQGITLPPGDTAYNVSKAAVRALTETLGHDLVATAGRVSAHLLIPGFTYTGLTRRHGITEKPAAAWTAEQVVEHLLKGMAAGDFYILCPDNDVSRATDEKRIRWHADDIIENRPALSRWHPEYKDAFARFMAE